MEYTKLKEIEIHEHFMNEEDTTLDDIMYCSDNNIHYFTYVPTSHWTNDHILLQTCM